MIYKNKKQPVRRRNHRILVSFTDKELAELDRKVACTGFTREKFMREVLMGVPVLEKPPAEYAAILKELRRMGSNVYQILHKELQTKFIDEVMLQDIYDRTIHMDQVLSQIYSPEEYEKRRV